MFKRQIDRELARQAPLHINGVRSLTDHRRKRSVDLIPNAVDSNRLDGNAERAAAVLHEVSQHLGEWISRIGENSSAPCGRQQLTDEVEGLCSSLRGSSRQSGDVAA